jgi:hypothetical protein
MVQAYSKISGFSNIIVYLSSRIEGSGIEDTRIKGSGKNDMIYKTNIAKMEEKY